MYFLLMVLFSGCASIRPTQLPAPLSASGFDSLVGPGKVEITLRDGQSYTVSDLSIKPDTTSYDRLRYFQKKRETIPTRKIRYVTMDALHLQDPNPHRGALIGASIGASIGTFFLLSARAQECRSDACIAEALMVKYSMISIPVLGGLGAILGGFSASGKKKSRYYLVLDDATSSLYYEVHR